MIELYAQLPAEHEQIRQDVPSSRQIGAQSRHQALLPLARPSIMPTPSTWTTRREGRRRATSMPDCELSALLRCPITGRAHMMVSGAGRLNSSSSVSASQSDMLSAALEC